MRLIFPNSGPYGSSDSAGSEEASHSATDTIATADWDKQPLSPIGSPIANVLLG